MNHKWLKSSEHIQTKPKQHFIINLLLLGIPIPRLGDSYYK